MIEILRSPHDAPSASPARAAIVTFLIGDVYERIWTRLCAPSWINYARRTNIDIIVLKDRIDAGDVSRSPAWQKLLILDLPWAKRYERIIWLDSDIIINDTAPDILMFGGPVEKVGACEDCGRMGLAEAQIYLEGKTHIKFSPDTVSTTWPTALRAIYNHNGTPPHDKMINTGVLVLSPAHHNEVLKSVYPSAEVSHLCEQPRLSHGLLERDLVYFLSPRYNWGIIEPIELILNRGLTGDEGPEFISQIMHIIVRSQLSCAYFLHFYGAMTLLKHYAKVLYPDAPDLEATAA